MDLAGKSFLRAKDKKSSTRSDVEWALLMSLLNQTTLSLQAELARADTAVNAEKKVTKNSRMSRSIIFVDLMLLCLKND
jgi:hypothetical protein